MKCPECGSSGEDIDWRQNDKGQVVWNCFECEHEWTEDL